MGAQETWEGVFGHQTVDPLLCILERVGTWSIHQIQQSLAGFSVQVYLEREQKVIERSSWMLYYFSSFHVLTVHRHPSGSLPCGPIIAYSPLHQPPVEHQGWWTGCRCCWPWPSAGLKAKLCSPHRPARTQGSPHWTLNAGTHETPEDHLEEEWTRRGGMNQSKTITRLFLLWHFDLSQ